MTSIRICEESDARLMIRDGIFKDYVREWCDRFPQRPKLQTVRELHDRHGLVLKDALLAARSMGTDEEVFLEVGDRVRIRKRNDKVELFRKVGTVWARAVEGMDALDSAGVFDDGRKTVISLCTEEELLNRKSVKGLERKVWGRLQQYRCGGCLMSFGGHEIWEWDVDTSRIQEYTQAISDKSFFCSGEKDVAEMIGRYRKAHGIPFGPF